jgi:predicted amidohydrolase YtcJ
MLPGSDRPVRVQHRSGALWIVNSAAVARLGLDDQGLGEAGVERDADGRATGRLWRMDRWLSDRLATRSDGSPADLAAVSARAASLGVTGFTDATPGADAADVAGLAEAVAARTVVQRVLSMARADVTSPAAACGGPRFGLGPVKIILDDDRLPSLDDLARQIRQAHAAGRAVAVHCVTRVQLLLTLAALDSAGRVPGDRIEHCALAPAETVPDLRGLTVVTQPHFVAERAGQYLADVPPVDAADLWRLRSLIDGGVAVAAGSDAPFGGADPWHVMRAATDRPAGLGPGESVSPAAAMRLFLGEPHAPVRARLVAPGHPADLVLLRCSPAEAARSLASDLVAAVFIEGRPDGR